jgi:hypothetical protein
MRSHAMPPGQKCTNPDSPDGNCYAQSQYCIYCGQIVKDRP